MPVDFTFLEPDGLQVHIRLNALLHKYGFFTSKEQQQEFDSAFEKIIRDYLPYSDDPDDERTAVS